MAGARAMAKSCELVSSNENLPYHCITAAGIFTQAGEREATLQFLQKLLAVTDNQEVRELAMAYLSKMVGEREGDEVALRLERFNQAWGKDLPFVSKDLLLIIGPPSDPARCAGTHARYGPECAVSWRAWGERQERR
jgi:hypothetical protein